MLAAASLAACYLLGLGLLAAAPALRALADAPGARRPPQICAGLAGILALGLLANQLLVLALRSLSVALATGCAGAVVGLALGLRAATRSVREQSDDTGARSLVPLFALPVALLVGAYAVLILTLPLQHWDARSIWFFQAKILYFAGGLFDDPVWRSLDFAHGDYPKLLPILAAQVARVAGFWNETLPKAALLALLVPAAIGYTAFLGRAASAVFLIALAFLPTYPVLWNGYADGPLALYAGVALLALGRWRERGAPADALLGIAALGVAASLKNEGALLLVAVAVAGLIVRAAQWGQASSGAVRHGARRSTLAWLLAFSLAGPALWGATRIAWGLSSDVAPSSGTLAAAAARLGESGALASVLRALFVTNGLAGAVLPLALALAAAALLRARAPAALPLALLTACLYLGGIVLVYLGTPHDLAWHLETSADRTVLPLFLLIAAATAPLLDAIEQPTASRAGSAQ